MFKLFKTLIILYSTVATVSATTVQIGEDYPFNPLTYGTTEDPASNYDVIVPKQTGTTTVEQGGNQIGVPVYQKQLQQAMTTNNTPNLPVYTNSNGTEVSTTYGENSCTYKILVQQYGSTTVYDSTCIQNLEFNGNNPSITKALKSNFITPYQINGQDVFRQKMNLDTSNGNIPDPNNNINLEFNGDNSPKIVEINTTQTIHTPYKYSQYPCYVNNDGNIYYYENETIKDCNGNSVTEITISDLNIIYRQEAGTLDESDLDIENSTGLPYIVRVLDSLGNPYSNDQGKPVFRQMYKAERKLKFDADGNPVFIEGDKIVPYFKQNDTYTEVDDTIFDIGQLVKVTTTGETITIQACVDKKIDSIKWYDLKTYIDINNYLGNNSGNIIYTKGNTNFIVKSSYEIKNVINASYNNNIFYDAKLFIPTGIILNIGSNISGIAFTFPGNSYNLICGTINNLTENNNSVFGFNSSPETLYTSEIVMAPSGTINNNPGNSVNAGFFNGGGKYLLFIVYPGFTLNDNFTDATTPLCNNINTLSENPRESIGTGGILYLNRFLDPNETGISQEEINKRKNNVEKLKVLIDYNINIVLPKFLKVQDEEQNNNLIKRVASINYSYIDLFPDIIWEGYGNHISGTRIPMDSTEATSLITAKYFFEEVYGTKRRYVQDQNYSVDFVSDNIGRGVLSLKDPENPAMEETPFTNPFAEEDEAFLNNGYNKDKVITEGGFTKPTYESSKFTSGGSYNPMGNDANNKYWDTATIDTLFVDSNNNPYMLSQDIPATLNVGLIGDKNVSTNATTITLNGDNQYYTGTYTVPESAQINLNHENALVSINTLNGNDVKTRPVVYRDVKKDPTTSNYDDKFPNDNEYFNIDDLSGLTYNVGTNINWDVSKTKNLLYNTGEKITEATGTNKINTNIQEMTGKPLTPHIIDNTDKKGIVLDMKLVGNNNFITFTNSNNSLVVDTITFNRANGDGNNLKYFIPSPEMNTVIFESENSIVKIPYNLNLIFTNGDTVFIEETSFVGVLLKKVKYGANKNITTIIYYNGGNKEKYTRVTGNSWKKDNGNSEEPSTSGFMSSFFCNIGEAEKEEDNRDTIDKMRDPGYKYNNSRAIDGFYLNTTKNGYYNDIIGGTDGENQKKYDINQLYHNSENINANDGLQNKMPPILNIGLVNNGNLTIVNSDINNTKVEINGINYGIRDCCSMNLLYWNAYDNSYYNGCTKEVDDNNKKPIGKPYTGELTVPNEIKDVEFGTFSFIPLIKIDDNNSNNPDKPAFTGNYTFKGYNIVQYYNTGGNIEAKNDNLLFPMEKPYYDYSTNELTLNLNKVTVNKGVTVILNNAHISVKAPTP